jgi:hypothetical protein
MPRIRKENHLSKEYFRFLELVSQGKLAKDLTWRKWRKMTNEERKQIELAR